MRHQTMSHAQQAAPPSYFVDSSEDASTLYGDEGWSSESPFYQKEPVTDFQRFMREGNHEDENGRELLTDHQFSNHSKQVRERFQYMLENNITKKTDLPLHMQTRKFNQKPLPSRWEKNPTMTVTSLPDDYVHYSNPRTFSVREWARMQTFPDKHIFSGPRTTGGHRRAGNPSLGNWTRDVPKYTQIGNAVPPLLGKAIGERVKEIISEIDGDDSRNNQNMFLESLSEENRIKYNKLSSEEKKNLSTLVNNPEFVQLVKQSVAEYSEGELRDLKKESLIWKSVKKTVDVVVSNSLFKFAVAIVSGGSIVLG